MRIIFHIDVNSAYLSWTAVEQLKNGAKVDIRTIPAIIGGDQKSRHGIVLAKSIPAKKYGIRTGEPVANAFRKCPNLVIEPPDHKMYREKSRMLMDYLRTFTKEIEQVSVDECYVDMTQAMEGFYSPVDAAMLIKNGVREKFGFTVNVGISSNKLLAKMASDFEKPDKVHTLFPEEIRVKMWPLPIGELFMAGKSSVKALNNLGIRTIGELAASDPKLITLNLKSHGTMLWNYANGIDNSPVCSTPAEAKGIGNSTTLSSDLTKECEAVPILHSLAESVASRLRKAHKKAGSICVEIKYYDFQSVSRQTQIDIPTNSTDLITQTSKRLFHELWNQQPVRLLGIRTTKLVDENEPVQLSLFDLDFSDISANKTNANADFPKKPSPEKQKKLDAALDSIRKKYGKKAVTRASEME